MRMFAVTVYIEATDTLSAIEAAQDYLTSCELLDLNREAIAGDGALKVRPACADEGPAR